MSVPLDELRSELTTLLGLVRELNTKLPQVETRTKNMTLTMQKASAVAYGVLGIMKALGLPPPLDEAAVKVQRFIMLLNQLRIQIMLFEAASGPLGWALAGIGAIGFAVTIPDQAGTLL